MTAQGWFCKAPLQMFSMSFLIPPGRLPSTSYTSVYLECIWATASKTTTCPQSSCENHRIGDKLRFRRLCQANCFAEPRQLNVGVGTRVYSSAESHWSALSSCDRHQRLYLDGERRGVGGERRVVSMFFFSFFQRAKNHGCGVFTRGNELKESALPLTHPRHARSHTHTYTYMDMHTRAPGHTRTGL